MPGRVGRPPKSIEEQGAPASLPKLGEKIEGLDMRYFESEMKELPMQSLQRWFIASGSRQKAEQVANLMVQRFAERLAVILDGTELPE